MRIAFVDIHIAFCIPTHGLIDVSSTESAGQSITDNVTRCFFIAVRIAFVHIHILFCILCQLMA
jgi:hypothetical protein